MKIKRTNNKPELKKSDRMHLSDFSWEMKGEKAQCTVTVKWSKLTREDSITRIQMNGKYSWTKAFFEYMYHSLLKFPIDGWYVYDGTIGERT